jgi:hypothetical protein
LTAANKQAALEGIMKKSLSNSCAVAVMARAAAAVALLLGASTAAFAQARTLEGAWIVVTQQRNCTTNAPIGQPHRALVTYHAGGTLSDSSAVPGFAIGQRSEGHGIWRHDGGQSYAVRWVAMIQFDTPAGTPPGSPGFLAGWQVATNAIELSGPDSFTSTGVSEFLDLNGQVYRVACASRTAERFK